MKFNQSVLKYLLNTIQNCEWWKKFSKGILPFFCMSFIYHLLVLSPSNYKSNNYTKSFLVTYRQILISVWKAFDTNHHLYAHAYLLSCFSHVRRFVTLWTVVYHASPSMGILQARILEWVAMPSSRGSSPPRNQIQVSCTAGRFFTIWATREARE